MKLREKLRCPNCGTAVAAPDLACADGEALEVICPICQLHMSLSAPPERQRLIADDLETQLYALIERALASALPPEQLAHMLGDALTYVVEYAHPDRRFFVEVVDLGMANEIPGPEPFPDLVKTLRQRYLRRERGRQRVRG